MNTQTIAVAFVVALTTKALAGIPFIPSEVLITSHPNGELRTYELTTTAELRGKRPPKGQIAFSENANQAVVRTGNKMFDGLYAFAVFEALENSVSQIRNRGYDKGEPIDVVAYQTGERWTYVWTRDVSYSIYLGLGQFDPPRAVSSLLFKASGLKSSPNSGHEILQDTGSGGSYPVSSDRIVWALGAYETLKYLSEPERAAFLAQAYAAISGTLERDRLLIFDSTDGLYRGEQSFLDWRDQTYPTRTAKNVLPIAMSKSLSVNVCTFAALHIAAEMAQRLGDADAQTRYEEWAAQLKTAINRSFYDSQSGLYRTYLLSDDGVSQVPVDRYDLLGESLAILSGVSDVEQTTKVLQNYPTGAFGPPVVWPQERTIAIYHNQAIWPFVTAFWMKAGQKAANADIVNEGVASLMRGAAMNLSNMENFDFLSGRAEVLDGPRRGPSLNSRRQLWSVAGYLSMVQDVVFGLETTWDGIRFSPFITTRMREELFSGSDRIELRHFVYRGTLHNVKITLPEAVTSKVTGAFQIGKMMLNGEEIGRDFITTKMLRATNEWEITLKPETSPAKSAPPRFVKSDDESAIFAPAQPKWMPSDDQGVSLEEGRLVLRFEHENPQAVSFRIYRDGKLYAENVRETKWIEPEAWSAEGAVHSYAVAAVDLQGKTVSHLTSPSAYRNPTDIVTIPASGMINRGGNLVADHFENWGGSDDLLTTKPVSVPVSGRYAIRIEFSNGSGSVGSGITCGVKKVDVTEPSGQASLKTGYAIMPQSGEWKRMDLSSSVIVELKANTPYTIRISEDAVTKNMSYFEKNRRYTARTGGGSDPFNKVNVASVRLFRLGSHSN